MNEPNHNPSLRNARLVLLSLLCSLASACAADALNDLGGEGESADAAAFAEIYATATFQMCADCHAPGADGATVGTETTQDWSSSSAAYESLMGNAAGLIGNFAGCNGVPLVGATANTSLVVAVLDPNVRASFSVASHPNCKAAAIADETLRLGGSVPPDVLQDLKDFIDDGGFR
jgi:hypothetical protein